MNEAGIEKYIARNTNYKRGQSNPLLIYTSNNGREHVRNKGVCVLGAKLASFPYIR